MLLVSFFLSFRHRNKSVIIISFGVLSNVRKRPKARQSGASSRKCAVNKLKQQKRHISSLNVFIPYNLTKSYHKTIQKCKDNVPKFLLTIRPYCIKNVPLTGSINGTFITQCVFSSAERITFC